VAPRIRIGINPLTWTNDDMPELGGDTPLSVCLSEARAAGTDRHADVRLRALWAVVGPFERLIGGEALRLARLAVRARRGDEPSWSSHVLYGDPGLTVLATARPGPVALRPRVRFGPFVLEDEIGRGGMGVVWKAYQPSLERHVALKFLQNLDNQVDQSRERFKREARVVARLRHPNVLQVYDFDEEQGYLYLATEYVPEADDATVLVRARFTQMLFRD